MWLKLDLSGKRSVFNVNSKQQKTQFISFSCTTTYFEVWAVLVILFWLYMRSFRRVDRTQLQLSEDVDKYKTISFFKKITKKSDGELQC